MSSWLVTGGVGFIGYHVSRALLARGDAVTVLDDFSDAPYPARMKERNAQDLAREFPKIEIARADITRRDAISPYFSGKNGVIHLAGLAGVRPSFANPARYAEVNVDGTTHVMELTRESGATTLVIASSSSVYGNSTPLPAHEDSAAIAPESPYAASKRGAELMASTLVKKTPTLTCAALRFFTVYGPRQRPEMAITLFARAILAGDAITMYGDGSMRRDFTHVDDIVRGVLAAVDKARPGFRPYNLGSGAPVTLADLVQALGDACGREPSIVRAPQPLGDVDATFADITRAKDELGWSPRVALGEGIRTVVRWVRENP